jgi:hypothetical protein
LGLGVILGARRMPPQGGKAGTVGEARGNCGGTHQQKAETEKNSLDSQSVGLVYVKQAFRWWLVVANER